MTRREGLSRGKGCDRGGCSCCRSCKPVVARCHCLAGNCRLACAGQLDTLTLNICTHRKAHNETQLSTRPCNTSKRLMLCCQAICWVVVVFLGLDRSRPQSIASVCTMCVCEAHLLLCLRAACAYVQDLGVQGIYECLQARQHHIERHKTMKRNSPGATVCPGASVWPGARVPPGTVVATAVDTGVVTGAATRLKGLRPEAGCTQKRNKICQLLGTFHIAVFMHACMHACI